MVELVRGRVRLSPDGAWARFMFWLKYDTRIGGWCRNGGLYRQLAAWLPRRVGYWLLIRAAVHATTGEYSSQVVPDLRIDELLKRWNGNPCPVVQRPDLVGLLETAWGVIANAGEGNWTLENPEWVKAAETWRDRYHREVLDHFHAEDPIETALQNANPSTAR